MHAYVWNICATVHFFLTLCSLILCYTGSLKSATVGIFIPWKLANAVNQGSSTLSLLLNNTSPLLCETCLSDFKVHCSVSHAIFEWLEAFFIHMF